MIEQSDGFFLGLKMMCQDFVVDGKPFDKGVFFRVRFIFRGESAVWFGRLNELVQCSVKFEGRALEVINKAIADLEPIPEDIPEVIDFVQEKLGFDYATDCSD